MRPKAILMILIPAIAASESEKAPGEDQDGEDRGLQARVSQIQRCAEAAEQECYGQQHHTRSGL